MTSLLNLAPETRVNTYAFDDQSSQAMATLTDGSYVIVWRSYTYTESGGTGGYGVYFQQYSASGVKIGGEIQANSSVALNQLEPDIAATDDGGFVIVWEGNGTITNQTDDEGIFAQRFTASGVPVGAETRVNTTTPNTQYGATVSGLVGGGFAVTWTSYNQDGSGNGVYQQVFNGLGAKVGSETRVNVVTAEDQFTSDIATLADGSYVITWTSTGQDAINSSYGVYARHYNASGVAMGGEFLVNTTTSGTQYFPQIAALSDGGYVITWEGNGAGDSTGIFFRRYDANGAPVGNEVLANLQSAAYSQAYTSITGLDDGGFFIAWSSNGQDGSNYGIVGQRFDDFGRAIGNEVILNAYTTGSQQISSVTGLAGGGLVAAWTSFGEDGSAQGVYSRGFFTATTLNGVQYLYGTADADELDGGSGGDWMFGGQGDDVYVVNSSSDHVVERGNQGFDEVRAAVSHTLGDDVENLTLTGLAPISGTGNDISNIIMGNAGGNWLSGLGGNDYIDGGKGDDYMQGGDLADTLYGGDGDDVLDGGTGNDKVYGGEGDDFVTATTGTDRVDGGAGFDTFEANTFNVSLILNLANGTARMGTGNFAYLTGIEALVGGFAADTLQGDGQANLLNGYAGADKMYGGAGSDTYWVEDAGDIVSELAGGLDAGGDSDLVISAISYTLGSYVEDLTLWTFAGGINGTGNGLDNTLTGNDGANVLDGKAGADIMYGGYGDDTYVVDNIADVASEDQESGYYDDDNDLVQASVSYTLGDHIERLTLTGTAIIHGGGNGLDNILIGNTATNILRGEGGNDSLNGGAGADVLYGGAGNDTYTVDNVSDTASEQSTIGIDDGGTDRVNASVDYTLGDFIEVLNLTGSGNISATGSAQANTLTGNSGANRITGGGGNDNLTGGAGADTFVFNKFGTANGIDRLKDFVSGTDKLSFTAADHGWTAGHVLLASEISFTGAAVGATAQFVYNAGTTILYWDSNGSTAGGLTAIAFFDAPSSAPAIGDFIFT